MSLPTKGYDHTSDNGAESSMFPLPGFDSLGFYVVTEGLVPVFGVLLEYFGNLLASIMISATFITIIPNHINLPLPFETT